MRIIEAYHRLSTRWLLTLAYALVIVGGAYNFWALRMEIHRSKAFDDKRAYELCVLGNETRADINARFDRLDQVLASFSNPHDPRLPKFLAEERASALQPRVCVSPRP